MKCILALSLSVLAMSAGAYAQSNEELIDKALAAAPRNMKEGATVIKWKADFTYEVIKKGTNKMVCYDRSDEPGRQPFAVQCTSLANLPRVAQNRKFEMMTDKSARDAALAKAEADGSRIKPEFGSVFISLSGPDKEHAHAHTTVAVPGATKESLGLPDTPGQGGAWLMNPGTSTAHIMTPGS
ncbi:MAG TPA: hypothetical protein VKG79_06080 [Bryobacteraceae bacterium]|nr:hypothetical protein [Bryobacteraceae bacterium]